MSYSYVKTVFPDFKYVNVYDTKVYENLSVSNFDKKLFEPAEPVNDFSFISTPENVKDKVNNRDPPKIETFQNNQNYYNIPLPTNNIAINNNKIHKESFEQDSIKNDHLEYTKHILECAKCKELLLKQFNIESDRIRNEEIMELISFMIFGLFILLLIDSYKK